MGPLQWVWHMCGVTSCSVVLCAAFAEFDGSDKSERSHLFTRSLQPILSGHHTLVRPYFSVTSYILLILLFDSHQTWYMTPSRLYNNCWYVSIVWNLVFCKINKKAVCHACWVCGIGVWSQEMHHNCVQCVALPFDTVIDGPMTQDINLVFRTHCRVSFQDSSKASERLEGYSMWVLSQ